MMHICQKNNEGLPFLMGPRDHHSDSSTTLVISAGGGQRQVNTKSSNIYEDFLLLSPT